MCLSTYIMFWTGPAGAASKDVLVASSMLLDVNRVLYHCYDRLTEHYPSQVLVPQPTNNQTQEKPISKQAWQGKWFNWLSNRFYFNQIMTVLALWNFNQLIGNAEDLFHIMPIVYSIGCTWPWETIASLLMKIWATRLSLPSKRNYFEKKGNIISASNESSRCLSS